MLQNELKRWKGIGEKKISKIINFQNFHKIEIKYADKFEKILSLLSFLWFLYASKSSNKSRNRSNFSFNPSALYKFCLFYIIFIKSQTLRMEFKRTIAPNVQPPNSKTSPLIQPLLNIAKASTPVRTRIVKPGSQMNSTPINIHKIGNPPRSPISNKENNETNLQLEQKKPKITQNNINLSPILALNRKLTEGFKRQNHSSTPNGFKREQSLSNIMKQSQNIPINQYQTTGPRESQAFGQTLQFRTSNSFKTLIQSRARTPNQNSSKKMNESGQLGSSGSVKSLLSGMKKLKESKSSVMSENRSFDQLMSLGNSKMKEDEILCSNDHKQKFLAKYKVVKLNYQEDDEQMLAYCSKCAIGLVNQNFKVEELTKEEKNMIKLQRMRNGEVNDYQSNRKWNKYGELRKRLVSKLEQVKKEKEKQNNKYNDDLETIDQYYNSLISVIEEQKNKDKEKIIKHQKSNLKTIETVQNQITSVISQIDLNSRTSLSHKGIAEIQKYEKIELNEKNIFILDEPQHKFDQFIQMFYGSIKLSLGDGKYKQSNEYYPQDKVPADSALRFSFEKMLMMKQKNKMNKYQIKPLEEAEEDMEAEESVQYQNEHYGQKKAFRTLFPQGQGEDEKSDIHSPTFKQF